MLARACIAGLLLASAACGRLGFEQRVGNDATIADGRNDADASDGNLARANRAFVSRGRFNGNLGGVTGADAICQAEAAIASLDGEFIALLKADTRPDPAQLFANSRGWQLPSGRWVADLPTQLSDGSFFQPINEYSDGIVVDAANDGYRVWSGDFANFHCNNWLSTVPQGDQAWLAQWRRLSDGPHPCSETLRLFCFERGQQHAFTQPPITHKRIFLSNGEFTPGSARTADALCQTEATAALLPGTYQALLPAPGVAALDNLLDARTTTYQRVDGITVGLLGTSAVQHTYITLSADGTVPADSGVWTGGDPAVVQVNTCNNWRSAAGMAERSAAFDWPGFEGLVDQCSTALRLYCIER